MVHNVWDKKIVTCVAGAVATGLGAEPGRAGGGSASLAPPRARPRARPLARPLIFCKQRSQYRINWKSAIKMT